MIALLSLLACAPTSTTLGSFTVSWDEDAATLTATRNGVTVMDLRQLALGQGTADVRFSTGSYLFEDIDETWVSVSSLDVASGSDAPLIVANLRDADGVAMGSLQLYASSTDQLQVILSGDGNRARASFACTGDDVFLGGGEHAFDVNHAGEAFPLWVSEPGIDKLDTDTPGASWFIEGTRHSSSFPAPFLLRPGEPAGYDIQSWARVDVDLCASNPDRWSVSTWDHDLAFVVHAGNTALDVVGSRTLAAGGVRVPPEWAFAPWNDAVGGPERVESVAATLRDAGAPSSAIWTEDFRGGEDGAAGYHPLVEWEVDRTLYTDPEGMDADLEAQGFKWLAYFSPFIAQDSTAWDEGGEAASIRDADGQAYTFLGATLHQVSVLDVSDDDAYQWALDHMADAVEVGFDGWMGDFGEWLPTDAVLTDLDAMDQHNLYTARWHQLNAEALDAADALGRDVTYFGRSGWYGTGADSPVHWIGDQQTDWELDDGLPSVVPMMIGASVSGMAVVGSDIAGYSTLSTSPTDQELWFRWCTLGAFSPVMRTHHGAYKDDNWQFDTDAETLAHFARYAVEHTRLFPYLYGLAVAAESTGQPLVLHPGLVFDPDDHADVSWDDVSQYMLGPSLLVAPVLEQGATGRDVALPGGVDWYDWFTLEAAQGGTVSAEMDEIPVFVASGSLIPTLTQVPDTLVRIDDDTQDADVVDLDDVDGARTLYVVGAGGSFVEGDGTTYVASGAPTGSGQATETLTSGSVDVSGVTVAIEGEVQRAYTVVVVR